MERRNCSNSKSNSNGYFDYEDLERRSRIEHPVSKLDTLAGIAIKYGVDVADIKKLNGLSTDLQMFALKKLEIPLPGKHPPSPCLSNGNETRGHAKHEQTPHRHVLCDLLDSFQSLRLKSDDPQRNVSPAMNSLQGYYGLKPSCLYKDSHRKTRSLTNFTMFEKGEVTDISLDVRESESDKRGEKLVRRRQKSEDNFSTRTPEILLKEDCCSNTVGVSAITRKSLALRPTAASRTAFETDTEGWGFNSVQFVIEDPFRSNGLAVRKSSSMPNFLEQDSSSSTSIRPLSSAATSTKPIGLPNPNSGWKNKAALD